MLLTIIYIIAITAEAMTGALSAGRRSMDWFGVVIIACVTALGGGSVRDVLLGHYPLTWVKHPEYLMLTCFAAFMTILIAKWMRHLRNIFLVLDALGLIGFYHHWLSNCLRNGTWFCGVCGRRSSDRSVGRYLA